MTFPSVIIAIASCVWFGNTLELLNIISDCFFVIKLSLVGRLLILFSKGISSTNGLINSPFILDLSSIEIFREKIARSKVVL